MSDGGFTGLSPERFKQYAAEVGKPDAQWGSPVFTHDCTHCIFLGNYYYDAGGWGLVDLYYCPGKYEGGSVVYRHSDEGSDYGSLSLELIIMRDYPEPSDNNFHLSLRRIFDQHFTTMLTDGAMRRFRVHITAVEIIETDCPHCRPEGWWDHDDYDEPDPNCLHCHGHGSTTEEKPLCKQ